MIMKEREDMEEFNTRLMQMQKQLGIVERYVMDQVGRATIHSITQELIDEGAFDVAKSYIDFLKARANKPDADRITVSPAGRKTMKKNNGAEFGPDTKRTKTSGIQEAIDKMASEKKDNDKNEENTKAGNTD